MPKKKNKKFDVGVSLGGEEGFLFGRVKVPWWENGYTYDIVKGHENEYKKWVKEGLDKKIQKREEPQC